MPFEPILAGMPAPTARQPDDVRSYTSTLASEPPTPTTETTCVALPTWLANHGTSSARACGAATSAMTATHNEVSSRRMPSIVCSEAVTDQVDERTRSGIHRLHAASCS